MQSLKKHILIFFAVLVAAVLLGACDSSSSGPEVTGLPLPDPVNAKDFPATITQFNPFFPLKVGMTTVTIGDTGAGIERIEVEVTDRKKLIDGVVATVVRDRVWLDNELIEDTDDWYAQDKNGNVWYLGEDVKNYRDGQLTDRHGSWEHGVDGAMGGINMYASPKVGKVYRQEYYKTHAEDVGEVLAVGETVQVPYGTLTGCVKTEDTTPLEPDVLEHKFYCPGVGMALTIDVADGNHRFELVEVTGN